jgi:hypothetical protein
VTHTYLKKLEEGRANVSLATIVKLSGDEVSLLDLLDAAVGLDPEEMERWVLERTNLQERMKQETGGRVLVEARVPHGLEDSVRDAAAGAVRAAVEGYVPSIERLEELIAKVQSVVVTAASISAAMERQWEQSAPPSLRPPGLSSGREASDDGVELVGSMNTVECDDGSPG